MCAGPKAPRLLAAAPRGNYRKFQRQPSKYYKAMFTLYRIGFCSVSKVAPLQCEQELMFCCGAEIVPKRSQCEQKPNPLCNLQRSVLIWKDNLPKRGSVASQKPIRYGTFHFQQRSRAVLFRSRNCFESSSPSVNRSPIRYTFCDAPFHYPVQCEHSLSLFGGRGLTARFTFTYGRNVLRRVLTIVRAGVAKIP